MKKALLILAIVGMAIGANAQAYTETSSDSITVVNSWYLVKGAVNYNNNTVTVVSRRISEMFLDGELESTSNTKDVFTLKELDTLFKYRNGNIVDTFLIKPVYDKLTPVTLDRLLKKSIKYKLKYNPDEL